MKLSEEAIQKLQQLQSAWFAIYWGFIPLMCYLAYFGDEIFGLPGFRSHQGTGTMWKVHTLADMRDGIN